MPYVNLGKILEGRIFLTKGYLTEQHWLFITPDKAGSPDFWKSGTESYRFCLACQESRGSGRAVAFLTPVIMASVMHMFMSDSRLTRVKSE